MKQQTAFFLTIPHSGEQVPAECTWLQNLPEPLLMCDVDRYVDQLYYPVIDDLKLLAIISPWHRYLADLNRLETDVDADSVEGSSNKGGSFTTGLHWVKTTRGEVLMHKPITQSLHKELVKNYHRPFHDKIEKQYADFFKQGYKQVLHLDLHSMPSLGTQAHPDPGEQRAEIVISDVDATSCDAKYKDLVIEAYESCGFQVKYSWPYKGGRLTQRYGRPAEHRHVIQVELNRSLYMNEESKQLIVEKAEILKVKLAEAIAKVLAALS